MTSGQEGELKNCCFACAACSCWDWKAKETKMVTVSVQTSQGPSEACVADGAAQVEAGTAQKKERTCKKPVGKSQLLFSARISRFTSASVMSDLCTGFMGRGNTCPNRWRISRLL